MACGHTRPCHHHLQPDLIIPLNILMMHLSIDTSTTPYIWLMAGHISELRVPPVPCGTHIHTTSWQCTDQFKITNIYPHHRNLLVLKPCALCKKNTAPKQSLSKLTIVLKIVPVYQTPLPLLPWNVRNGIGLCMPNYVPVRRYQLKHAFPSSCEVGHFL